VILKRFGPNSECTHFMSYTQFRSLTTFFAIFLLTLGSWGSARGAGEPDFSPCWPLDLPTRYLTSNFMEYRPGRFHAGIDLKTDTVTGFAVRAVEDGHIVRLRATPFAYGRAVYLKGLSGRTYVYAHLMRFNDELRRLVQQKQDVTGQYRTRIFFAEGEQKVSKGQVIGLSGQSGAGGPHLHFEVRDEQGRPLNPHDQGFPVDDRLEPVIFSVTAWPAAPGASVNGLAQEHRLKAAQGLRDELPPLLVQGPVAFSARMVDASDQAGHRLEPWHIEVKLNDRRVYSCRNERFAFAEASQQRLEWADHTALGHRFREHWLHRAEGVELVGRQGDLWYLGENGEGLPPGEHELEILARDRSGNLARVVVPLIVGKGRKVSASPWMPLDLSLVLPAREGGGAADAGFRLSPFFVAGTVPEGANLLPFHPDAGHPVLAPLNLLAAPLSAKISIPVEQGLVGLGPASAFRTSHWPLDSALRVPLAAGAGFDSAVLEDPRVAVYRLSRRGKWQLVGPATWQDGQLHFHISRPGTHALLRDEGAPVWDLPEGLVLEPARDSRVPGVSLPRWRVFGVGVDDPGSGIASETIAVTLNGRPLIVEPDLPRRRILVELPDDLDSGAHHLDLRVEDKAGNAAEARLEFQCP
jgi:hypothetical protein